MKKRYEAWLVEYSVEDMIQSWREHRNTAHWLSLVAIEKDYSEYPDVFLQWQFTDDAFKALKFETKESAELLMRFVTQGLGYYEGHKLTVTQHIFEERIGRLHKK